MECFQHNPLFGAGWGGGWLLLNIVFIFFPWADSMEMIGRYTQRKLGLTYTYYII